MVCSFENSSSISFANELADLMDKYDVRFCLRDYDNISGVGDDVLHGLFILQNDWDAIDVPFDWHSGIILPSCFRGLY